MRITLNKLRRIIREALAERMEFKQAEELYSELIMGAMRDNRGNVSAMQAAMRAIPAQVLELTGWSVEEIQARTQRETGERIKAMKQGRP
jgi:hypothetical protein